MRNVLRALATLLAVVLALAVLPANAQRTISQDGQNDPITSEWAPARPWPADIDWLDVRHRPRLLTVRIGYYWDGGGEARYTRVFVDTRRDRHGPEFEVRLTLNRIPDKPTRSSMKVFRLAPLPAGATWVPPRTVTGPGVPCSGMTTSKSGETTKVSGIRTITVPRRCLSFPGRLRLGVLTQGYLPDEPSRFEDYAPGDRNDFSGEGSYGWTAWLRRG